jgi:hypothetical protein
MIKRRLRIKHTLSLKDWLSVFAMEVRQKAAELPPGIERDVLLRRARQADTATHLDAWVNSSGLQPPK